MRDTNRSLWLAVIACVAMGFFAKSPDFFGEQQWITVALAVFTIVIGFYGFWIGLRGARAQRTMWSWLAPGIHVFLLISFLAFLGLWFKILIED